MNVYSMNYERKEVNKKVRAMFNELDLDIESTDGAGRVIKYALTDAQTLAFLDRWNPLKNTYAIREKAALNTVEQVIGIELIRQFKVGAYRVDGLHVDSSTIYEVDEEGHYRNGVLRPECAKRQKYIEKCGYKVIRIRV